MTAWSRFATRMSRTLPDPQAQTEHRYIVRNEAGSRSIGTGLARTGGVRVRRPLNDEPNAARLALV